MYIKGRGVFPAAIFVAGLAQKTTKNRRMVYTHGICLQDVR